jgi:NAD(P)-dependent dehydrogenase (short-subunit alcohol dehydrogenase family)
MPTTYDLSDQVVIVTGASGNVGSAVVRGFAAAGSRIALVDVNAERLAAVIESLGGAPERYLALPANLSDDQALDALLAQVAERLGPVTALANTVGGYEAGKPAHEAGLEVWDKMMNLNARLTYLVCAKVARQMIERQTQGSISTIIARAALKGTANHAAYTASKAAALRVVESMALELRDYGIRVNGVSPSTIDTPANRQSMPDADFTKWVQPAQIADLIVFLASPQASPITGAHIEINARS